MTNILQFAGAAAMLAVTQSDTLPSPDHPYSIGWVAVILVCIVLGINAVMDLVDRFKPKPPLNEQYVNQEICKLRMGGVFTQQSLNEMFVPREVWDRSDKEAKKFQEKLEKDIKVLLQRTAHMASTEEIADE